MNSKSDQFGTSILKFGKSNPFRPKLAFSWFHSVEPSNILQNKILSIWIKIDHFFKWSLKGHDFYVEIVFYEYFSTKGFQKA